MQYAFLIYSDKDEATLSADESARRMQGMQDLLEETTGRGILPAAVRLQNTTASRTARQREGTVTVLDGPFAETKEFLAGILVIDCASTSEAEAWAKRLTQNSCSGTIEYRPVAGIYGAISSPERVLATSHQ